MINISAIYLFELFKLCAIAENQKLDIFCNAVTHWLMIIRQRWDEFQNQDDRRSYLQADLR
jgi:hypothetical protein